MHEIQTQYGFDAIQPKQKQKREPISGDIACQLFVLGLVYKYDFLHLRYNLKLNKQTYLKVKSLVRASNLNKNNLTLPMRKAIHSRLIWDWLT